jgi:uncharacterized protein
MQVLYLILKTVERCNLNCDYCYFFNGRDQSYLKRPKFVTKEVVNSLVIFIQNAIDTMGVVSVNIILHGGEPLMQPKEEFIYMIETIKNSIKDTHIEFGMQTNATLVSKNWIELLNKYNILPGVSIDGPKQYNDLHRVDHNGNGSYDNIVRGIKLLQEGLVFNSNSLACLVVVNPDLSGSEVYRHLIDLGFKKIDFLLPDNTHDSKPTHEIKEYARFLVEVFEEWAKDDNDNMSIRIFESFILQLLGYDSLVYGVGRASSKDKIPLVSVRSNGDISPTDELMSTDPQTVMFLDKNIGTTTLSEVISSEIFKELHNAGTIPPEKCSKCCWYNACGGGALVNRFSKENRFNNPSIFCEALQEVFAHITSYMINSGVPKETITSNLFKN